ncbi:MAG: PilZ domain-containing protein [Magnetococcales bacterium]|nr:PilZ domain-containing protein [Magnetococcales bacterium]
MDTAEQEQKQEKERPEVRPLAVYGQTVVDLFAGDLDLHGPVCLLPIYNRDQVLCQESYQEFFLHAQEKWSEALRAVALLQENLAEERRLVAAAGPASAKGVRTPILDRYTTFQEAIRSGDEEGIEDNPFLKLTRMIFHLNMQAAQGTMREAITEVMEKRERMALQAIPPIREIWRAVDKKRKGGRGVGRKLADSLRALIIGLKPFISILLFVLSSVTTFRGINELLQLPVTQSLFGTLFAGIKGEAARYVVGVAVGLGLSLAILDFKGRLFQGFAETGRFWRGLLHALGVNPRWIVLATFLTFFSIYTNYDGIVSLVSKQGELQKQWTEIKGRVELVLGDEQTANPDHPQTLFGLKKALELTVRQAIGTFVKLPEDELSGIASSQDPRKGPRYWAKHFVVFGGHVEGTIDLAHVYAASETARNVNAILLGSKLDFSKGIEEKIRTLTARYTLHFATTSRSIQDDLDKLDRIMRPSERSVAEMRRFMTLEYYDINALVQHITASFEENKRVYDEVATELNKLIRSHIAVLRQVDKYGNTPQVDYHISATVDVPAIEGIAALKRGVIPVATHKDIAALNRFLADEYGKTMAGFILMAILLFSISLDLGELLLFIGFTLRIARRDEKLLEQRLAAIAAWNDTLIDKVRGVFEKKEIWFSLLSWLPRPSEILMRDATFMWLYSMDGELRHQGTRAEPWTRWWVWFSRLFSATVRKEACYGLQAWDRALDRIQKRLDRDKCQFLGILYPGLRWDDKLQSLPFTQLGLRIAQGMKQGQARFERSLRGFCGTHLCKRFSAHVRAREEIKSRTQRDFENTLSLAYKELDPQTRRKRQEGGAPVAVPGGGGMTGGKAVCPDCGTPGLIQAWRCVVVKGSDSCPIDLPVEDRWLSALQRRVIHVLVYSVFCPLWWAHRWLFSVAFVNDEKVFPWSRKKWLYDFCISNKGQIDRRKIRPGDKKDHVDFEYILSKITALRGEKIGTVVRKLEAFDGDWARAWKLSICHYEDILKNIEDEARMIRGLGKDARDVAGEMRLYNRSVSLGSLLYYESPHDFSLLEQFKTIEAQIEDALERVDDVGLLDRKKSHLTGEIEETCADVNRLLVKIKTGLVSGDVDYQSWKIVGGDKVYQQVTEEMEGILKAVREFREGDIVEQGAPGVAALGQMLKRSQQLRDQLMDAKVALSHPVVRSGAAVGDQNIGHPAASPTRSPLEPTNGETPPIWSAPELTGGRSTTTRPGSGPGHGATSTPRPGDEPLGGRWTGLRGDHELLAGRSAPAPFVIDTTRDETVAARGTPDPARDDGRVSPDSAPEIPLPTGEARDLFPERESIRNSNREDWAIAVRGGNRATPFREKIPAATRLERAGYMVARSQPKGRMGLPAKESPPLFSPFRSHAESIGSRRETERSQIRLGSEFTTAEGVVYQGTTEDVSITGVRMRLPSGELDPRTRGVTTGAIGTFRFLHLQGEAGFPCRVVRVVGDDITLAIHEDTSRYGLLVMQEILSRHKVDTPRSGRDP